MKTNEDYHIENFDEAVRAGTYLFIKSLFRAGIVNKFAMHHNLAVGYDFREDGTMRTFKDRMTVILKYAYEELYRKYMRKQNEEKEVEFSKDFIVSDLISYGICLPTSSLLEVHIGDVSRYRDKMNEFYNAFNAYVKSEINNAIVGL